MIRTFSYLLVTALAASAGAVEIIAHRGASHDAPENTLAAVQLGWKQDADVVEIDIYLTADSRIVCFHDKTTKRTAGEPDVPVARQTLAQLRSRDAGRWKGEEFAGERIPLLEEVLETIPANRRLFIELKAGPEVLPELKRVLDADGKPPEQTAIIGFSYDTMRAARELFPKLKLYWLVDVKRDEKTGRWNHTPSELVRKTKQAGFEGLNFGKGAAVEPRFIRAALHAGLECYVWTVNDADVARRFRQLGVHGITTDRPGWLREQLAL